MNTHTHTRHVWHGHISFSFLPSEYFMSARQDTGLENACWHFFVLFDVLLGSGHTRAERLICYCISNHYLDHSVKLKSTCDKSNVFVKQYHSWCKNTGNISQSNQITLICVSFFWVVQFVSCLYIIFLIFHFVATFLEPAKCFYTSTKCLFLSHMEPTICRHLFVCRRLFVCLMRALGIWTHTKLQCI